MIAADAYGEATLRGHLENRNGQRYLKFDKMDVDIALSNYHIYLGNLFGNDPVLSKHCMHFSSCPAKTKTKKGYFKSFFLIIILFPGESVNQAINANNKDFIKVIKPIIDATAANILLDVANNITEHFTFDQLFPEN